MTPLAELVREEIIARGWTLDRLATRMTETEWGINRLALDLLLTDPPIPGLVLGDDMAEKLAAALGTSKELFVNLDRAWREAKTHGDGK